MPKRPDGRIEPGQRLSTAISARAWNRAQDAADIVLGERTGFVVEQFAGRSHILGKTTAAWDKGTAQNVSIWGGPLGNEEETSSQVRAWNKFGNLECGSWVILARVGEHWYVIAAECPE